MTKKESANIETIDPANQNRDTKSWTNNIKLPPKYLPKQKEEYMCDKQLKYFYEKLLTWKNELIQESNVTVEHLKEKNMQEPDNADRATFETDTNIELRTRERYLKLITKINQAISRIENKTYGYCEKTGEEIGIKRLMARPIAIYTVEAQEKRERSERLMEEETEVTE
jgi:DnaK suppressor protein